MSQAIFGLVGVVIGGILTGGVQLYLERRREATAERVARRLVTQEVLGHWVHARLMIANGRTLVNQSEETVARFLPTDEWRRHRDDLARSLSDDEWRKLALYMESVEVTRATILELPPGTPIPDGIALARFHSFATSTYTDLAGHPPEDLLNPDPRGNSGATRPTEVERDQAFADNAESP